MRLVVLFACVGAVLAVPQRIVGGAPMSIEQYPYLCNMQKNYANTMWVSTCGGSLINTRSVLSAAHCYHEEEPVTYWRARLGSSYPSTGGIVRQVSEIVHHDHFDRSTLEHDVAVVRLAAPATLSATVQLARIAGPNFHLPDGTTLMIMGWGGEDLETRPEQLRHVDVNIINQHLCADRYAHLKTLEDYVPDVTAGMLCVGTLDVGGKGPCDGDWGGPLVHSGHSGDVVVGIVSFFYRCGHELYPSLSTRVSHYSDWISIVGSN